MDLSVPLQTGMPVYPGDPEVRITSALTVDDDGANVLSLAIGSHSGTHVDAPYHVHNAWAPLGGLPPQQFSGPVDLVDVRNAGAGGVITAEHLAAILPESVGVGSPMRANRVLLLHTGFAEHWGSSEYRNHPWLDASAARLIVQSGYRTVGLDALSVDRSAANDSDGQDAKNQSFPAHQILAGSGCVIVENLTGLEQIAESLSGGTAVEIFLFPLNIPNADGSPVRAMARPALAVAPPAAQPQAAQPQALSCAEVQDAADRLIAAFAATDTENYFASFSPSATFIFHPERATLGSRREYRDLWDGWLGSGWRVLNCRSSEQNIQILGTTAVFTHRVATLVQMEAGGATLSSDERETIVFTRADGGAVLAVHEHLSAIPPAA